MLLPPLLLLYLLVVVAVGAVLILRLSGLRASDSSVISCVWLSVRLGCCSCLFALVGLLGSAVDTEDELAWLVGVEVPE